MFPRGSPGLLLGAVLACLTALKAAGAVVPAPQRFMQEVSHHTTNMAAPQLVAIVGGKPRVFAGGAGNELASGSVFLLPYYMGLYHGFIAKP